MRLKTRDTERPGRVSWYGICAACVIAATLLWPMEQRLNSDSILGRRGYGEVAALQRQVSRVFWWPTAALVVGIVIEIFSNSFRGPSKVNVSKRDCVLILLCVVLFCVDCFLYFCAMRSPL